jgi:probable HAF family extracellular repeat protein
MSFQNRPFAKAPGLVRLALRLHRKKGVAMRAVPLLPLTYALCTLTSYAIAAGSERYAVTDLPSLGGTVSRGNSINDAGLILGYSRLPGNQSEHAVAWLFDQIFDLNTLGGPNSDVAWPLKSSFRIAGISQTAAAEVLGENWSCSAFFPGATAVGHVCRGFVSDFGHLRELPTLGGENGYAAGDNHRGEIAGWAETTFHDPTCEGSGPGLSGQVLQFLPVIYSPDHIQALPLLSGDSSGAATAVNDSSQVVGISGDCDQAVGRRTARHAVLWEHGRVIDIGQGHAPAPWWNTPAAINERGVVVGFLGDPRDVTGGITHAFIWSRENGLQRLVPGDYSASDTDNSTATSINNRGQVVGYYTAADGSNHGFIWDPQEGLQDLNNLKQPDYTKTLELAMDINDRGQITGRALDPATNTRTAVLINPTDSDR